MKADAQLEYAIFQLTPTRTRCELHIVAKGVTYKLASGLLKPFVSHLKTAEEQLAKGGYSLRLEPPDPSRAAWFTKGTMERFVRFVSTPEVLERVSSVEVELLELEETTRQQTAESNDANAIVQIDAALKAAAPQSFPGGKLAVTAAFDKGTKGVLDGAENGSEENSKQRLLRALDARRMMLQKDQGMAFARALAAGFNLENMDDLVLFAECFGADRLREACIKFVALSKKRQEAGLGIEDLELAAADTASTDMFYMGTVGGNAMGLAWPHLHGNGQEVPPSPGSSIEGKQAIHDDFAQKQREEPSQTGLSPNTAGEGEFSPAVVKGHPMMAAWQGQPHNQMMPGVPPYAAIHPGMANHFDPSFGFTGPVRPGQMGLAYPHFMGGSYIPSPYSDGNGWQPLSAVPPQYWAGNQANDPIEGSTHRLSNQQSLSTASSRDKETRENRIDGDDSQEDEEDYASEVLSELSGRRARRSTSPRRRSTSPSKKVQVGRTGGSKRSGMVVIRNINYITPKAEQQDTRDDDSSEDSDSWSEESDEGEARESGAETLRTSIEDAMEAVEGKHRASKEGKRKHSKKNNKKKVAARYSGHHKDTGSHDVELDDDESKKNMIEPKEYVWTINRRVSGDDEISKVHDEEGLFSGNRLGSQDQFDPTSESVSDAKKEKGMIDAELRTAPEDVVLLSRNNNGNRSNDSDLGEMFKQEQFVESKKVPLVDDSCVILDTESSVVGKINGTLGEIDFNVQGVPDPQVGNLLQDDSFILLDRASGREAPNEDRNEALNLEAEMPPLQCNDGGEADRFEPDDLFMVPDRGLDAQKRGWNNPLEYDMHVLAADFMDTGRDGEVNDVTEDVEDADVQEPDVEGKPAKLTLRKLSEKDSKALAAKEMLERRKSTGGVRTGRSSQLAEAQLRAEKLRLYKAGLQKSKQEREEEDRKRIEDLRIQRQQRIAARSNPAGSGQFSPSAKNTRTPLANKSSPKVSNKVSPLSSSASRERLTNGSRPRTSDCTKPTESSVTRSISSLTELHREPKKHMPTARASTGSQVLSPRVRAERHLEVNSNGKLNGHAEERAVRSKVSRNDDKIGRSNSGLTEERIGRSESGRIDEKVGRTESGRLDGLSESGRISEKALPIATRATKRVAARDMPALHVKSPRSSTADEVKKTTAVPLDMVDGLASQVRSPKSPNVDSKVVRKVVTAPLKPNAPKKTNLAPKATTLEKPHREPAQMPSCLKEDPKVGKPEVLVNALQSKDLSPVVAEDSPLNEPGQIRGSTASMAVLGDSLSVSKGSHENEMMSPIHMPTQVDEPQMGASHTSLSVGAEEIIMSDVRQLDAKENSPVVEECGSTGDHLSFPVENDNCAFIERDISAPEGQLTGGYSPPFAPPSENSMSPSANRSLTSPTTHQECTAESSPNEAASARSRKKWGDSKAKGLKRLLLLGRKSGRSSNLNAVDVPSDGEEEESHSSSGKGITMKLDDDPDVCVSQAAAGAQMQGDFGPSNSSSKGSRSIFSLSTFRGHKSTVKV